MNKYTGLICRKLRSRMSFPLIPRWRGPICRTGPFSKIANVDHLPATSDIMPEQFFFEDANPSQGEKALMLATLEQAKVDFQNLAHAEDEKKKKAFEEICGWFEERGSLWPFSYENICTELDIDADRVYRALCRWKDQQSNDGRNNGSQHTPS